MLQYPDKQPWEEIPGAGVDFASKLLSGETVNTAVVTEVITSPAVPPTTALVDQGTVVCQGTKVLYTLKGGVDGDSSTITVRATGTLGSKRETEVLLNVVEL